METARSMDRLREIDWDFFNAKSVYLTHGLHPYPAKFIPQIPRILIEELSTAGDTVGDIFCGSGTTLVEAIVLKRNAVGVDANPLACLISKAKTTVLKNDEIAKLHDLVKRSRSLADTISLHSEDSLFGAVAFRSSGVRPSQGALDFWFEPFVVEELAEALGFCNGLQSESARQLALTALSSIIVSVSRQDSDTRYVRRQKRIAPGEPLRRFSRSLAKAVQCVRELNELVDPRFRCCVHKASVLDKPEIGRLDLVVCSPPYPNAYSYHLYHMTRMLWLGMDHEGFKNEEMGSHRKYSRKGADIGTFGREMSVVFEWLCAALERGKYACFVIGDSIVKGTKIDNASLISSVAREHGFSEEGRLRRRLQDTRKAFNPKIGKIKNEELLILRNAT